MREAVHLALAEPVTLDFAGTPITDVITFLQDFTRVNMILDRGAIDGDGPKITLRVTDMPLRNALVMILDAAKLEYAVRGDALFISNHEGLAGSPELGWPRQGHDPDMAEEFRLVQDQLRKPVTLDFAETPLRDVVTFMQDFTGINMVVDPELFPRLGTPVTMRTTDVPIDTAMGVIAYLCDMRLAFYNGMVVLTSAEAGRARMHRNRVREGAGVLVAPGFVATELQAVQHAESISVDGWRRAKIVSTDARVGTALLRLQGDAARP